MTRVKIIWKRIESPILGSVATLLFALLAFAAGPAFAALSEQQMQEVSAVTTSILLSARKVISDHQGLINDAEKGDKGLTVQKVLELTKQNYQNVTGKPAPQGGSGTPADEAAAALYAAISEIIERSQPVINQQGKGYKNFLPAIFAARVANRFNDKMENRMRLKLTAPKSKLRNPANLADAWEDRVLETTFGNPNHEKGKPYFERAKFENVATAYRYILPEYYGPSCLSCHGTPKSEMDISGWKKEGAQLGDLGGAISFVILR